MAIADDQMLDGGKRGRESLHRAPDMGRRGPLPWKRERIAQWVRRRIARGEIAPGEALPSREWFVRKFTPNPRTVQEAFDELRRDGLVETVRGHATRVARRMPFEGRYLLLTKARTEDTGSRHFAHALAVAADALSRARGIVLDVVPLADVFNLHCGDIAAAKAKSVAVFAPLVDDGLRLERRHRDIAAEHGLEIARCCYHEVKMYNWHPCQFRRLVAMVLSQPWVDPRTAFVLEDDNMLSIFEDELVRRFGKIVAKKMCVCCHANSPILPKSALDVKFHGMDCTATLASAIDYSDACRRNERNPPPPRVVVF